MNQPLRISPSASSLIADALLDGESVDMGRWQAVFQDAVLHDAEQEGVLSRALLLWHAGLLSADALRAVIRSTANTYAQRYKADWITARDKQRKDEAVRERDEERLIGSAY